MVQRTLYCALIMAVAIFLGGYDKIRAQLRLLGNSAKDAYGLYLQVEGQDWTALELLRDEANGGNAYAALQYGYIYHVGAGGVTIDYARAARAYLIASGVLPMADYNLGLLYLRRQIRPAPSAGGIRPDPLGRGWNISGRPLEKTRLGWSSR